MSSARRYNQGKRKWHLMHYESMEPLIEVLEYGLEKYTIKNEQGEIISTGHNNWRSPMDLDALKDCMQRHLSKLMDGEEYDEESGVSHIGHIHANCMMYTYHKKRLDNELKHP